MVFLNRPHVNVATLTAFKAFKVNTLLTLSALKSCVAFLSTNSLTIQELKQGSSEESVDLLFLHYTRYI